MFYSQQIKKGEGIWQTNFFLTQGDLAVIKSTPTINDGSISPSDISGVEFVLATKDGVNVTTQSFTSQDDSYVLSLTSNTTNNFAVGTYDYHIKYTLTGGNKFTTNQGEFTVYKQLPNSNI